ncbi:CocE/NonD family hydrolase [Mesobacterium pallidum]|uniref:CocE/NonD family hydrolase n=1 Tax=Mesobacterium pallidum TaxID=2872037 RepID=UPI001EE1A371|nr:CocE/NonD family hydrolase [Mesobacterium pallidum]
MNNFIYAKQPSLPDDISRHGLFSGFKPSTVFLPKGFRVSETCAPLTVDIIYEKDVAVTLRDGTTIYTDVLRPVTEEKVPVIVAWSPYGKSRGNAPQYDDLFGLLGIGTSHLSGLQKFEGPDPAWWCARGYAICHPDPRGSHNSDGDSRWWSREEGEDFHDLVEWCGTQDWSNGKVAASGNSYLTASQWFMAAERPAHLAAIAPWEGMSDIYRDLIMRGGIPDYGFSETLRYAYIGKNQREDLIMDADAHPLRDSLWERRAADFSKIDVPAYVVASYSNSIHTPGTFRGWRSIASEQKWLRIHATMEWPDYYTEENQLDLLKFFDRFLKGIDNGWDDTPIVRYTLHDLEGNDRIGLVADQFPPKKAVTTRFYLDAAENSLTTASPEAGSLSYDATVPEGQVSFEMRVDANTAFVGYPRLHLNAAALEADDMDIFVLLQKVDADGKVLEQITVPNKGPQMFGMTRAGASILCYKGSNGRLRASMRHLDAEKTTEDLPVHSFDRVEKLTPGAMVTLDIELFPMGLLLYPGEALRLTIGGHNTLGGAMPGTKNLTPANKGRHVIHTGGDHASWLSIGTMPFAEE